MKNAVLFFFAACFALSLFADDPVPSRGFLSVVGTEGATVCIDRKEHGQVPLNLELPPGDYYMEARKDGFFPFRRSVTVRAGETVTAPVDLREITGMVLAESEPGGAEVRVGGITCGKTPCLMPQLPLGTHTAHFILPGHRETKLQFEIKDRTPLKIRAALVSETATVLVSSNVDGTEIKINGVPRGVASAANPLRIDRIAAGDVVIEAYKEGYRNFTQVAKLGQADLLEVAVALEEKPASLQVFSIPEMARVYIDDNYKGETPLEISSLEPGTHRIRVEKEGYDPMARNVTAKMAEALSEEFRLKSNRGTLRVITDPPGVAVSVDGAEMGKTLPSDGDVSSLPLEIGSVKTGKRKIVYYRAGYEQRSEEIEVSRNETVLRQIKLKKKFLPDYSVETASGLYKGVLESIGGGMIRLETKPGVTKVFSLNDVLKHGEIK